MIVIHIDNNTLDTKILSRIYEKLNNITLLHNEKKSSIKRLLRFTGNEPVMLLGHGNQLGLFNKLQNGYAIDSECVQWLRDRPVIGIFCYASDFADKYGLHGFFTSMFISNMQEAIIEQRDQDATEEIISYQESLFCDRIHELLIRNTPMSEWPRILQSQADLSLPFVRFNYETLTYYE